MRLPLVALALLILVPTSAGATVQVGDVIFAQANFVYRMDTVTGEREIVSGGGVGSGPTLPSCVDNCWTAVRTDGKIVLISVAGIWQAILVDPVTGNRTKFAETGDGKGQDFVWPIHAGMVGLVPTAVTATGPWGLAILALGIVIGFQLQILRRENNPWH